MKVYKGIFLVLLLSVYSCKQEVQSISQLDLIISEVQEYKDYDYEKYPLGYFGKDRYENKAKFAKTKIEELNSLDISTLTETEKISYDLLLFTLQESVDYFEFEAFLNPLLSDSGFHTSLPHQVKSFSRYNQYVNYLNKLNALPLFVEQHIELMREGLEKGISQPKIIFNNFEDTYNSHITEDYSLNFYYEPFKNLPDGFSAHQKDSLQNAAKECVEKVVVPQFKIIKSFFEKEYFVRTRERGGVSNQPNGDAFYQNRVEYYTTLDLTASEVHEIGLKEVARIKAEMEEIIKEVSFKGDFAAFIEFLRTDAQFYANSAEELLKEARDISKRIDAELPRLFKTLPRKPYGVAPVPDPIAPKYTGGRYVPSGKNSERPGYYWVNTYNLKSRPLYILPALTLHEAVPGHHLQMSLNQELSDSIPRFRRSLYLSAYGEGWGLYAEYLGNDMNIYRNAYEEFGKLTYEMWRACRLVVDTGIHVMDWSREKAVEYLSSNTALSLHEVNTEIDRYISWPGQALSYKIGEIKIRELREKAENELGDAFSIRAFHEILLEEGTVTLSILERRVNNFIEKSRN